MKTNYNEYLIGFDDETNEVAVSTSASGAISGAKSSKSTTKDPVVLKQVRSNVTLSLDPDDAVTKSYVDYQDTSVLTQSKEFTTGKANLLEEKKADKTAVYTKEEVEDRILWEKGTGTQSVKNENAGCSAVGNYSLAEGKDTIANNLAEHAEGIGNVSHTETGSSYGHPRNTQHSIGIGTATERKNAEETMQNGDKYIIGIGGYEGTDVLGKTTLQNVVNAKADKTYVDSSDLATLADAKAHADTNLATGKAYTDTKVGNLKSYTDTEISELKEYTDTEISDLKDYTDAGLTAAANTSAANLATAKAYTDTKVTDLKNDTTTKLNDLKLYTDACFADAATTAATNLATAKSYTDTKVGVLKAYTDTEISDLKDYTDTGLDNAATTAATNLATAKSYSDTNLATGKEYTDTKVSALSTSTTTSLNTKADKATTYTKTEVDGIKSELATDIGTKLATATYTTDQTARELRFKNIEDKIPSQASTTNQLADKEFVNSSIASNTGSFVGTFDSTSALPSTGVGNNDYAFVTHKNTAGLVDAYNRYKYSTSSGWKFEYTLNNSSFTASEWAAIQSGITDILVAKLNDIESGAQVNTITGIKGWAETSYRTGNVNITKANIGLGNVNNTSDADKPVSTATQTAISTAVAAERSYMETSVTDMKAVCYDYTDDGVAEAKSYADGLLTDAKDYTDAALAEANGYAENLFEEAKGYADTKSEAALTSAKTYTDGEVALAVQNIGYEIANTKSYADFKSAAALSAAKTYTDEHIPEITWDAISGKPTTFTPASHNQASNTINKMTGYTKPSSTSAISATDTLNDAIGKLEKALDEISVTDLPSSTITKMTGYSKPSATSAIATSDSLNGAIGKLEKGLDSKQATLVGSGTGQNIKTVGGVSIIGSGNIPIGTYTYPLGSVIDCTETLDPNSTYPGTWVLVKSETISGAAVNTYLRNA